jgi:hypothetical protein
MRGIAARAARTQDAPGAADATVVTQVPTVQQVAAIFETHCGGGCHDHQGSDGFVFDGQLRTALLDPVEAAPTPAGVPPNAAACRSQRRITPGDPANSYLLRKIELGLGRSPSPVVCGAGMPRGVILDASARDALALDYERLKLWIAGGAPLQ